MLFWYTYRPYHFLTHLLLSINVNFLLFVIFLFVVRYKWDTPFERDIKREVFKIVRRGREYGTNGYFFRAFFYIALFFTLQYFWVTIPTSYALAIVYGLSQAFIGLNVQHDANHGAASKKAWVNDLLGECYL